VPTMGLIFSETFSEFLNTRARANQEDAIINRALRDARFEVANPTAMQHRHIPGPDVKNWLDIETVDGRPHIFYTTPRLILKAGHPECLVYAYGMHTGKHRISSRAGRVVQEITGITDGRALDVFTSALSAHLTGHELHVELVRGEEISHWYAQSNYCACRESGDLWSSCMRYNSLHDGGIGDRVCAIYEEAAQMAVVLCPTCTKLCARAIVWTVDGREYYDRVYANSPRIEHVVHERLTTRGMTSVYMGNTPLVVPFTGDHDRYDRMPYMDTIEVMCPECKTLQYRDYCSCAGLSRRGMKQVPSAHYDDHDDDDNYCGCGEHLDEDGHCPGCDRTYCEGCEESYCDRCHDACPNGCEGCGYPNCYRMIRHGEYTCFAGHEECEECFTWYNRNHGRCPEERYCELHDEYFHSDECPGVEDCPDCGSYKVEDGKCVEECPDPSCPSNVLPPSASSELAIIPSPSEAMWRYMSDRGQHVMPEFQVARQ
jgi:hypothetical protein